jgi:hypothetical protein
MASLVDVRVRNMIYNGKLYGQNNIEYSLNENLNS